MQSKIKIFFFYEYFPSSISSFDINFILSSPIPILQTSQPDRGGGRGQTRQQPVTHLPGVTCFITCVTCLTCVTRITCVTQLLLLPGSPRHRRHRSLRPWPGASCNQWDGGCWHWDHWPWPGGHKPAAGWMAGRAQGTCHGGSCLTAFLHVVTKFVTYLICFWLGGLTCDFSHSHISKELVSTKILHFDLCLFIWHISYRYCDKFVIYMVSNRE